MARYSRTTNEALVVEISQQKDQVILAIRRVQEFDEPNRQFFELLALWFIRTLHTETNRDFTLLRVTFTHARNADLREVHRLLRCPVDFAQGIDSWVLPQRVMDLPIVSGDSQLLKILTAHADDLIAERHSVTGLKSMVANQLTSLLPSGESRAAVVARELGMSPRSLTRHLAEEGTTFGDIARGYSRQDGSTAQLLDKTVRKGVGANAEIDPRGAIAAEILEQYAASRKHRRAMRHSGAGIGKIGEIVAGGPVQPGMAVEENRVADDRIVAEHPDLAQPPDRRPPVPSHDLLKLDAALRRMNLQRQPAFAGRRGAVAQQRLGAGVALSGVQTPSSRPDGCWRAPSISLSAWSSPSRPAFTSQL